MISEGCCNFGAPRDPDGWGELPEVGVFKSVRVPVLDAGGVLGVEAAPKAGADDTEAPNPACAPYLLCLLYSIDQLCLEHCKCCKPGLSV